MAFIYINVVTPDTTNSCIYLLSKSDVITMPTRKPINLQIAHFNNNDKQKKKAHTHRHKYHKEEEKKRIVII